MPGLSLESLFLVIGWNSSEKETKYTQIKNCILSRNLLQRRLTWKYVPMKIRLYGRRFYARNHVIMYFLIDESYLILWQINLKIDFHLFQGDWGVNHSRGILEHFFLNFDLAIVGNFQDLSLEQEGLDYSMSNFSRFELLPRPHTTSQDWLPSLDTKKKCEIFPTWT